MSVSQGSDTYPATPAAEGSLRRTRARFEDLPPIYVLPTHMVEDEVHSIEDRLIEVDAPLTYDTKEARWFLTKIQQKRRAAIELRTLGLWTEEASGAPSSQNLSVSNAPRKRRRSSATSSTVGSQPRSGEPQVLQHGGTALELATPADKSIILVLRTSWLDESCQFQAPLPPEKFIVYAARITAPTRAKASIPTDGKSILARAAADSSALTSPSRDRKTYGATSLHRGRHTGSPSLVAPLVHETTSDHDYGLSSELPPPPDWVAKGLKYSCQRSTPLNPPNAAFIEQLKKIRDARTLTGDEIGVRAYSTAIAALAAYPHTLSSPREILALPGCNAKIAALFTEWRDNGSHPRAIAAVRELDDDPRLRALRTFHGIWGVGPATARDFYDAGWRDLDDVVEFGWASLSRVQQLGAKFYDEFQAAMPRAEVEDVEARVAHAARALCAADPAGVRTCIVGGYRRGQPRSGDADVIVSHVDARATHGLVGPLVERLQLAGCVSHTLVTHAGAALRGQAPAPQRAARGSFDALDKALVVWQDPRWDRVAHARNPNPHRRVDIIIAPWARIGCAVLGWSAGTTFERDLRRYADKVKGWRFDSSGIRDRATGQVVEVELEGGQCETIDEAERKVFTALGLEYRAPWERCTG